MIRRIESGLIGLCALLLSVSPALAAACPVCIEQRAAARGAYFNTTVLLSLLPLAFIGGVALFLRARLRAADDAGPGEPISSIS